jgi:hypothetical protein
VTHSIVIALYTGKFGRGHLLIHSRSATKGL